MRRGVEVAPGGAAFGPSCARAWVDPDAAHADRSITTPSSHVPKPGTLCPPPRTARSSRLSRAKSTAAIDVAGVRRPHDHGRGRRSIIAL